jgi:hypothetical protein
VRIDINENRDDNVNNNAMMVVHSSINVTSVLLARCRDVSIKRQNPSKLADVPRMCCDVLFAINID